MAIEERVKERIADLITIGERLRVGNQHGQVRGDGHRQECVAWFAPAENVIQIVCPNPDNAYRKRTEQIVRPNRGLLTHLGVGELTDLLKNLSTDIDRGLLSSLVDSIRAEDFDEFLDHGEAYHKQGKKNESGVIVGVVFEDTIRRICDKHGINQKGEKLDALIIALAKIDVISQIKAKRARAGADLRTKATHAQWDEFELEDVKATINFTRELIAEKLDN